MAFHLRDIIDLDFLLSLDDSPGNEGDAALSRRDREIFAQIGREDLDDAALTAQWLSYRKLLFHHQSSPGEILPGSLFSSLMEWGARGLFFAGLLLGFFTALSFLAYHGASPVNVTLFISVFIFMPVLFSGLALISMGLRMAGLSGQGKGLLQGVFAGVFFKKLNQAWHRAGELPGGQSLKSVADAAGLLDSLHRHHQGILFWPFFVLTSLLALGFSSGALGGTLFRVAVSDLAFAWQSTLVTSAGAVSEMVSWMAAPWSWFLPQALPGPQAIEGSRIILKEGMSGLSTGDLTAWWPFLSMGLLVYGVGFRLCILLGAVRAQSLALARIDLNRPRYRRLLARMRSPRMETRAVAGKVSQAKDRPPLPRPKAEADITGPGADDISAAETSEKERLSWAPRSTAGPALVLASTQAFPEDIREIMTALVEAQLDIRVGSGIGLSMDFSRDLPDLRAAADTHTGGPVLLFQEVWQPPIRGLLYYISQIRAEVFPNAPLWIILTQSPGSGDPAVTADDVDFKVWQTAVAQLADPGIQVERIRP